MSTTIKDASSVELGENSTLELGRLDGYAMQRIFLRIKDGSDDEPLGNYNLPEFLAAVEAEYGVRLVPADAVVILRETLPEVEFTVSGDLMSAGVAYYDGRETAASIRAEVAGRIALAEYLDANPPKPPVDEGMVAALVDELKSPEYSILGGLTDMRGVQALARRLYLAGVRIEQVQA